MKRQNKVLLTMMLYSLSNIILSVIGGIYGLGAIASGIAGLAAASPSMDIPLGALQAPFMGNIAFASELNSGLFGTANEISSAMNASFVPMMMLALAIAILPANFLILILSCINHVIYQPKGGRLTAFQIITILTDVVTLWPLVQVISLLFACFVVGATDPFFYVVSGYNILSTAVTVIASCIFAFSHESQDSNGYDFDEQA